MAASFIIAALAASGCAAVVDRRADARETAAEARFPPEGRLIAVPGGNVHAVTRGAGRDLVLIHGASGNTRDFTLRLVDLLETDFRVTVFDRPGLGWSDDLGTPGISPLVQADALRAAAETLGLHRPIVLGHSYGGAVAMAWALRDPETAGLVIVSGATMPWPGGLGPWYAISASRLGGATVVPLISAFASEAQAEAAVASVFAPQIPPPGYAEGIGIGLTLRRDSIRVNSRQVSGLKPHLERMLPNYPRLTLPVELVHGDADTVVPVRVHAEPLSRLLPDATLTVLPGVGHMPHHTNPEVVVAAIRRAAARSR
ncbi:alpha/beta hydrolase [Paracoccaceae bacterium Fryx2]|nr:alpha/beta hydrolase [Paracoccaceae bacterium Fryx2]